MCSVFIVVYGTGLSRSDLETTPDPASYWSLNEICRYRGQGMKLLMFDNGITRSHPSFDSLIFREIVGTYDDLDNHGTCCAGIACGNETVFCGDLSGHGRFYTGNACNCVNATDHLQVKFRGVAPHANLVIWKAYDYVKKIPFDPWLQQLKDMASYCAHDDVHVDVVVISSDFKEQNEHMKDAIMKLDSKGVIVVCAAGNDGAKNIHNIKYPALYPQTICVGANDRYGNLCDFSSVGEEVDVLALGEAIIGPKRVDTNLEDSNIGKYMMQNSGTSFAAAAVGALICLILQAVKQTCREQHYDLVKKTESMKKLLRELATSKCAICCEQLSKFFNDPKDFIDGLIASGKI